MDCITGISLVLVALIRHGHCRSTGAPVEACATLVPQHGSIVNSTDTLPYELVIDTFEDPGLPQSDGTVLHTYSYNPGTTYNRKVFNKLSLGYLDEYNMKLVKEYRKICHT